MLLHMAQQRDLVTSDVLAQVMDTNPVVIRRIMAGLRDTGYVHNAALNQSFQEAEALLLASFYDVTLEMLSADVRSRLAAHAGSRVGHAEMLRERR